MRIVPILILLTVTSAAGAEVACEGRAYPSPHLEREMFEKAAAAAVDNSPLRIRVGGIVVPHHLAAVDLMARAFASIEPEPIDKVIVLFPDHFRRARRAFAVTRRPFDTVFGPVCSAGADVATILEQASIVEDSDLFERDHGIGAVLPFVRRFMPGVPIVPIAVSISSRRTDWDKLVAVLEPMMSARTLVLQSTDFSHYMSAAQAALHDQATLNVLSAADIEGAGRLNQPAHLDSRGSQYIQMRLQERRSARPIVLFNANSQSYSDAYEPETTSYIVQIYPREPPRRVLPRLGGSQVICFAGDVFLGRFFTALLTNSRIAERLEKKVQSILRGCPLVVNLEGVFGPSKPAARTDRELVMDRELALQWLKKLNVIAASLANNHSRDLGPSGYEQTAAALRGAGIAVLEHGLISDLEALRIVTLSDVDNSANPTTNRITNQELAAIARSPARPPLIAFMHWGKEFSAEPGPREQELTQRLAQAAVGLVVGTHPHTRSGGIRPISGGEAILAYSLGNFLFDQLDPLASGAILEMRLFDQGTFFARMIEIPNLYDKARRFGR
jgi:AmmeMemoRadiSam system protein B